MCGHFTAWMLVVASSGEGRTRLCDSVPVIVSTVDVIYGREVQEPRAKCDRVYGVVDWPQLPVWWMFGNACNYADK